jgi:GntR family transcriptional regulator/MocR family aminotransferase
LKSAAGVFIQPLLDPAAAQRPQWARIADTVRQAILGGTLATETRLPSARQLARDWRLSRGVVDEAFSQLQSEGLIERRVGAGTYVCRCAPAQVARRQAAPHAQRVLERSVLRDSPTARLESAQRSLRVPTLHPRGTDIDGFPLEQWRRLLLRAHEESQRNLLDHAPAGGLPALRQAIARHLAIHRGLSCTPEQVLVVNGPGEALQLIGRLLLSPGQTMWAEDPGHASLPLLMRTLGVQVAGVPLDEQGFDLATGLRQAPQARLAYLHPLTQYPLGQRTHAARAAELLAWAEQAGAWIVEGQMNDELVPPEQQPTPLMARDSAGRVLMMGTFEGVMFPSLRVGYLVLPPALAAGFVRAAAALGEHVPGPVQAALAGFIDHGHMTAHLQQLRSEIGRRRETVRRVLLTRLPRGVRAGPLTSGTCLCLHLPPGMRDAEVAAALKRQRIVVETLSVIAWQTGGCNGIVFGYGGLGGRELEAALGVLADTLDTAHNAASYQPVGENA